VEFDYIIVGAGSAGCVLANRLSARPETRVLLIEAGGDDRPFHEPRNLMLNSLIHIPAGYRYTVNARALSWNYVSELGAVTAAAASPYPRGRVLGGSSSINGMIYVRGQAADFDRWRQLGCLGWGWEDVIPFFKRSEDQCRGPDDVHGTGGPLTVSDIAHDPVSDAILAAAAEAGHRVIDDHNRGAQNGFSYVQVNMRHNRRRSSAVAYLHPAMKRRNLEVKTGTLATGIRIQDGRATGIHVRERGRNITVSCRGEIILCGGVVNSPQILELSGIGDPAVLAHAGIDVRHALPGVGENLQDHWCSLLRYRLRPGIASVNTAARGRRLAGQILRYALGRGGILAAPPVSVMGFVSSDPAFDLPDLQLNASPASADPETGEVDSFPGFTLGSCQMRPESRGSIHVDCADPDVQPRIRLNFLEAEEDRRAAAAGLRASFLIARQPALRKLIAAPAGDHPAENDEKALIEYARTYGYGIFHGAGTCAMGVGEDAVVDPQLRVRGVAGLRIADASIMPRIISGNTNATAIMIGEKASALLLQEQ